MALFAVVLIFILIYAIVFNFFFSGWKSAGIELTATTDCRFISVIVPARNEEKNITKLLQALEKQGYPSHSFEVIVVDDYSTDATAGLVSGYAFKNLQLVRPNVSAELSSKKRAIEAGIALAKGELIVTTDADCIPPPGWLQCLNNLYVQQQACFIAAPVKFTHDNSLLQRFQSIDFLTLQGITAAVVSTHSLTMCNGANLAYTKKAFYDVNGFEGIDKVATGDDMLLMYKIWKKEKSKVFYLKKKEAIVSTAPMHTWKAFFMQRKRWASKTLVYDDKRVIAILAFVYLFNCLFPVLIIAAFFSIHYWWYVPAFWISKTIIEFPFVRSVAEFFEERKLLAFYFFLQPLHMLYTVFVGFISQLGKYEWKGRKTK